MTVHPMSCVLMSLFLPGMGQLMAGRIGKAAYFAFLALFMWVLTLGIFGWIINVCAALDAWHICTQEQRTQPEPLGETWN
jgi:TM2 domain-containing membrane protein YozV